MSNFGAMQDFKPRPEEYFISKWKQIIATTLNRAQAVAFRSIVAADSVSGAADIWGGSWRFGVSAPKCFASERERA